MNQTMKDFLKRNGINPDKVPEEIMVDLSFPADFNKYLTYFEVQNDKKKKYVSITDIIGSDAFENEGNIYDLMATFFDERRDPYHRRSTDLLEIPSEDIMERLKISFADDPIILAEYDGKYFVRTNGNHRVFTMYLNYLLESQNARTPEEIEALKKKYTFPAQVMEINVEKSYANYILQSKKSKKFVCRVFDREKMKTTDQFEVVSENERRIIEAESEIDEIVRETVLDTIRRKDTFFLEELELAAKKHESFRKYFSKIFPEIGENDVASTLKKISREIDLKEIETYGAESFDEILDVVNENDRLLKRQREGFGKFREYAFKTDSKMEEFFGIMYIPQDESLSIDKIGEKFDDLTTKIEDMFKEAREGYSPQLYKRAQDALHVVADINFPSLAKKYEKRGITELKEKIANMSSALQTEVQITEIDKKREEEQKKRFGILDRLMGKQKLRDARVKNLELQRQYIEKTAGQPKKMEEAVRELYNYMRVHGSSEEMEDFMAKLGKLDEVTDFVQLDKVCVEAFLPVKKGQKRISARKQAGLIEQENREIERKIADEKDESYSSKVKVDDFARRKGVLKTILSKIKQAEDHTEKQRQKNKKFEPIIS